MEIDHLAARTEIAILIARYNLLGDRGQTEPLGYLFTEDGVLETGAWRYAGREEIVSGLTQGGTGERDPRLTFMRHHLTTWDFSFHSPDTGSGRAYFQVITNVGLDRAGLYLDRYERVDGAWLIAHRTVRLDWISPGSLMPVQPTFHLRAEAGRL